MRRALYLFAAILFGAAPAASAQAHVRIGVRLQQPAAGLPNLVFSVTDLLDDPEWLDALNSAYRISLHWKVTLSRSAFIDFTGPPTEWNDFVWKIPALDIFNYSEPVAGRLVSAKFGTIDSLKSLLGQEQLIATPKTLPPGRWYYTVQLTVSVDDPADPNSSGPSSLNALQRFVLGRGPHRTYSPQSTATFTVPNR
jgi:hypothetical protein